MKNGLDAYGNPVGSPWTPEREKDALSRKSQTTGSNLALAIAEELVCDFSILNHDGNLMKGEHYWVGLDELKDYLEDCIMRNSNK